MKTKWIMILTLSLAIMIDFACAASPSLSLSSQLNPESIFSLDSGVFPTESSMTLTLRGIGELEIVPIDVVLAIDSSSSMRDNDPQVDRIRAAQNFIKIMDPSKDRFGLVSWDSGIDIIEPLTNNVSKIISRLKDINSEGDTNLDNALKASIDLLTDGESSSKKIILFLSDGVGSYTPSTTPDSQVNHAIDENITIYTIGLNVANSDAKPLLKDIALATGGKYYDSPDSSSLEDLFEEIGKSLTNSAGTNVRLQYSMPSDLIIGNYSIEPDNITTDGNESVMDWYLGTISIGDVKNITFNISSSNIGTFKLGSERSSVDFTKYDGTNGNKIFDEQILKINMNAALPPFKSGASLILESIPIDFIMLNQRAGAIYDIVESDESHIAWKFTGTTNDWVSVFNDGRIVVASIDDFNFTLKDRLTKELESVIDMINTVNPVIDDKNRTSGINSIIYYASTPGIYHMLKYDFNSDLDLTLFVPNSTVKAAGLIIEGKETGKIIYKSGQYYYIDGIDVLHCEMDCGPGCTEEPTCWNTARQNVTDLIVPGQRKLSSKSRSPHTLIFEAITSSKPNKKFVLYGPDYVPWINETSESEDLQKLRQIILTPSKLSAAAPG